MFTSVHLKVCRKLAACLQQVCCRHSIFGCRHSIFGYPVFAADLRRVCSKLAANLICMVKVCCMLAAYTQQYCCRAFTLLQRVYNLNSNSQRFLSMSAAILLQCLLQTCGKCSQEANIFSKGVYGHSVFSCEIVPLIKYKLVKCHIYKSW